MSTEAELRVLLDVTVLTGLILTGPFVGLVTSGSAVWTLGIIPALAFVLFVGWAFTVKRTRIGDAHWLLHGAGTFIWMLIGCAMMPRI